MLDGFTTYSEDGTVFEESYKGFRSTLITSGSDGHSRFSPMPDQVFLNDYYNGGFSEGGNEVYNLDAQFNPEVVNVARGVLAHMQAVTNMPSDLAFHDFGCAFGGLVYGFQQIGARASGNEPNKNWVEAGNQFCNGTLTHLDLPEALARLDYKIDLFTALHVIEHLSDPLSALRTMRDNLAPEGLIYICVPNAECVQYVVGGRRRDPLYSFPMHLQYFTAKSMASHLREAGLEPIAVDTRWLPDEKNGDHYAIEAFLGRPSDELPDVAAWKTALCANLLGGELFMLAAHPGNTAAMRLPDLDERIERAHRYASDTRRA